MATGQFQHLSDWQSLAIGLCTQQGACSTYPLLVTNLHIDRPSQVYSYSRTPHKAYLSGGIHPHKA